MLKERKAMQLKGGANLVQMKIRVLEKDPEEFLKKLSFELVKQCRDVFSTSRALNTVTNQLNILLDSGLQELPVLMMILEFPANVGLKIGTLIDPASDTNYTTHRAVNKLSLRSEDISLVVHGVGGMKVYVETKRYLLKIKVKTAKAALKPNGLLWP